MCSQRRLTIINYAIGIYTGLLVLLDYSSLADVREFIELHGWDRCWRYRDFFTYVSINFGFYSVSAAAFLVSWVLLRSRYWRSARFVVSASVVVVIVDFL